MLFALAYADASSHRSDLENELGAENVEDDCVWEVIVQGAELEPRLLKTTPRSQLH